MDSEPQEQYQQIEESSYESSDRQSDGGQEVFVSHTLFFNL